MSCPREGSSFLVPKTCPSLVFTVDLFFWSTIWVGGLLAHTSQFMDMLRLLILGLSDMHKILHLKTNGFSNQLMRGMSVLCKHKRWIIELTAFSGMGSVVWSIIYNVHSGKKKKKWGGYKLACFRASGAIPCSNVCKWAGNFCSLLHSLTISELMSSILGLSDTCAPRLVCIGVAVVFVPSKCLCKFCLIMCLARKSNSNDNNYHFIECVRRFVWCWYSTLLTSLWGRSYCKPHSLMEKLVFWRVCTASKKSSQPGPGVYNIIHYIILLFGT